MTVYERLKRYRVIKGRRDYLKLQLEGIEDNIKHGHGINETKDETIEGMAFRRSIDGMPAGGDNDSKVERIALNLDKERAGLRGSADGMFEEKRRLEQRIAPLDKEVKETEIMLSVIGKEERLVIENWFFDDLRIPIIQDIYYEKFKSYPAYRTIQRMKDRAISKMRNVAL